VSGDPFAQALSSRTSVSAVTKRNPKAGGAAKIDWAAARTFFLSSPTISFGDVARKFGVTDTAVRKHAGGANGEWRQRRDKMVADAAAKQEIGIEKSYEERQRDTIAVAQKLRDRVLDAPSSELDVNRAAAAIPRYVPLEAEFAGEPMGFDASQLEVIVAGVMRVARELVIAALRVAEADARRPAVLAYIDQHFPSEVARLIEGSASQEPHDH
jgi:hypothetical protein